MAESRSWSVVLAPRMEAPPAIVTFVLDCAVAVWLADRAGDADRDGRLSEMRLPAAEGGSLGVWGLEVVVIAGAGSGLCTASGWE